MKPRQAFYALLLGLISGFGFLCAYLFYTMKLYSLCGSSALVGLVCIAMFIDTVKESE